MLAPQRPALRGARVHVQEVFWELKQLAALAEHREHFSCLSTWTSSARFVAESPHTEAAQELLSSFSALTLGNSSTRRNQKGARGRSLLPYLVFLLLTLLVRVCRVSLGLTRARQPPRLLSLARSGAYLGSSLSNPRPSGSISRLPLGARRCLSK